MNHTDNNTTTTDTATGQVCDVCQQVLHTGDTFCRRCGANLHDLVNSPTAGLAPTPRAIVDPPPLTRASSYETGPLPPVSGAANVYHPVSGSLVRAIVAGLGMTPAAQHCSPLMKKLIVALSLLPIWLIIIFLSPLDAYLAAASVTARTECDSPDPAQPLSTLFP